MAVAILALVVLLVACGTQGPTPTDDGPPQLEGTWSLTAGRGPAGEVPLVGDHAITLTIEGTELSGTAACNHYGGRFGFRDGRLAIDDLGMTAMGCEPEIAASESTYLAALEAVTAAGRDGAELVLVGPDTELRFAAVPEPPTAELVDTVWVLESVFVGDVASAALGERATLELRSDGTFSGSTGCRGVDGRWIEQGDQILATSMATTDESCPPDLAPQDGHVVTVIGDGFVPSVEDDLLTLIDPGGVGLVYRAQR